MMLKETGYLLPRVALVDPTLSMSMPPALTAFVGVDTADARDRSICLAPRYPTNGPHRPLVYRARVTIPRNRVPGTGA